MVSDADYRALNRRVVEAEKLAEDMKRQRDNTHKGLLKSEEDVAALEDQLEFTRSVLAIQRDVNKREYDRRVSAEAEAERLRCVLKSIGQHDPRHRGQRATDVPNRDRLIQRAYDAVYDQ
jgi:hypothetical protein